MEPIQKLKTKKNCSSFLCLKEREPKNCPVLASKNVEGKKKRECFKCSNQDNLISSSVFLFLPPFRVREMFSFTVM